MPSVYLVYLTDVGDEMIHWTEVSHRRDKRVKCFLMPVSSTELGHYVGLEDALTYWMTPADPAIHEVCHHEGYKCTATTAG